MSGIELTLALLLNLSFYLAVCQPAESTAAKQQSKPSQTWVSPDLIPYLHARSIIDFSQRELVDLMPELAASEPAPLLPVPPVHSGEPRRFKADSPALASRVIR